MTASPLQNPVVKERLGPKVNTAKKLLQGYLHKTSNGLCGIKGYASLIADRENPESHTGRWASRILQEIDKMEEIYRSVGDLNMGNSHLPAHSSLEGILKDVLLYTMQNFPQLTIKKAFIPKGQLLMPGADLALVLKEILKNSAEASPGAEIQLGAQVEITGIVSLCLRDNGPGMDAELLKQAADPFVTTRDGHHGIGLTRVETILDMHDLAWSMSSDRGLGTTTTLEVAQALNWDPEIV